MCVAIPGHVLSTGAGAAGSRPALVDLPGRGVVPVDLMLLPDVDVGDYVIVHSGFAISRVDPREAEATFDLLSDPRPEAASDPGPGSAA
jgi:hydrogenase expression/formation protein HypC